MSRARGTYTTLENWALDLAPTLPGAAGWVLIRLAQRANYTRKTMTVGQLMDVLPYQPRALQIALAHLVAHGHAEAHGNAYCLRGARTSLAQDARTNVRPEEGENARQDEETQDANSGITEHKKKEVEGKEEIENTTPVTPQGGTAREPAAPEVQDHTWMDEAEQAMTAEGLAPDGAPAGAGEDPEVAVGDTPPEAPRAARPAKAGPKVPRAAATPTGQQEVFEALAVTCYGSVDALTKAARGRIAPAATDLAKARYTAEQVPLIAAWIRREEPWRTRNLAPQTIAERAPAWKSGGPGNVPLAPGRHAAPDATPSPTSTRRRHYA